jgi:hypothetical protein
MATTEQLLTQILAELKGIRGALATGAAPSKAAAPSSATSTAGGAVATDRELDSEHGDPSVRKDPKRWNVDVNGSYAGCNFSECPPEYLEVLADLFDWMGDKDDEDGKMYKGKPSSLYKRLDAKRARGWARRKREGWTAPTPARRDVSDRQEDNAGPADDPLPF